MGIDRGLAVYWGATAAGVCLLAPVAPQVAAALPECVFHSVTGLPCPVCGTTRAVLALSHLSFASAFALNPLASLGAVAFVLGGFAAGIAALSGRPIRLPAGRTASLRIAVILAVAANWGWLLLQSR